MENKYALLGVDMETDVGSFTPFYEGAKHGTPLLLDLFARKGVRGTFYFTGECARENPGVARMVRDSGNEVGAHSLYHETVGDELFPLPGVKPLLPHEVKPRLRLADEWIQAASGVKPVSFRSPRLWGSTAVVNALEELGYLTDATYPMYYYRERFAPYHPSREDWTKPGDSPILELPNFADMAMESHDPGLERDRDQWPLFRTEGAQSLLSRVDSFEGFCQARGIAPFICLYIHPWEFWPMQESYNFGEATVIPDRFITLNCGETALREMGGVIDGLKERGYAFATAKELWDTFPVAGA
ncbi:MAG TPA: polysaccharide deacetylase family protein [Candidatus Limnocylindria bacterium]|nr:polysaccharide deacetylase family protein [Candidatus Limnocylindria bacterium]